MIYHRISNWDDAYTNGAYIAGGERWPEAWVEPAAAFRAAAAAGERAKLDIAYGDKPRNRFDLFAPAGAPKGLVVFIHGGFWLRFDKSYWSHLARGAVESGFAVAMPSYTLCPQIRISGIVREIGAAIETAAGMVGGPIHLTGHSAGGHLAARMISMTSPLPQDLRQRIGNVVSISGVHDLRPMLKTAMNATLALDYAEAMAESPAMLEPIEGCRITCWVGGAERSEFVRQNALLANAWIGLGAATAAVEEPDRHHYNVIDGLADPAHPLTRTLLAG